MNKFVHALATAFFLHLPLCAQSVSTAADDGTTTIGVFSQEFGVIQLNTADESANLKFGRYIFDRTQRLHWINFSLGAKADEGVAALFTDGSVAPGFSSDLKFGYNFATSRPQLDPNRIIQCQSQPDAQKCTAEYVDSINMSTAYGVWFIVGTGLRGESLKMYDPAQPYDSQIEAESSILPRGNVGLNFWHANVLGNSLLGGVTLGIQRENNRDELTKEEIETVSTVTSPDGMEERRRVSQTTAYSGSFDEFTAFPFDADLIIAPHRFKNLAVDLLSRLDWRRDAATDWDLGAGILFLKDQNARTPLGGLFVLADDVLSDEFSDSSFWDQVKVSLVLNVDLPRVR